MLDLEVDLASLVPRRCDCNYCRSLTSKAAMISDPMLRITVTETNQRLKESANGSGQATFYHCENCDQLIVVGAPLESRLRGAVNSDLFEESVEFVEPQTIQPWLLSPQEKAERWSLLWGDLTICRNLNGVVN